MLVFHSSSGQSQANSPKDNIKPEIKGKVISPAFYFL